MLKVIIVDDEYLIRDSMESLIPWNENGFEVIGKAENGKEALALIEQSPPDLVISDIRMPIMTGLELLEIVKSKYPDIFFISISGYDDFEYVQKSLNFGANAYILKPIEISEIVSALNRIRESVALSKKIRINKQNIFANIYSDLIMGNFNIENYFEYTNILDSLYNQYFMIITITWNNYNQSVSNLHLAHIMEYSDILNNLNELVHDQNIFLSLSPDKKIICMRDDDPILLESRASELTASIERALKERFTQKFSIGVGKIHFGLFELITSYFESVKALSLVYLHGDNKVLYYNDSLGEVSSFNPIFVSCEEEIIGYMLENDIVNMRNTVHRLAGHCIESNVSSYDIQLFVRNVLYKAINCIIEANITVEDVLDDPNMLFSLLYSESDVTYIFQLLLKTLEKIGGALSAAPLNSSAIIIAQAKQYIQNNYMKFKLSLADVASHVNLHPAYFSTVFSKCENISFIDYLTNFRLEKAKKLLRSTNYKTTQIANDVGYQNSTYFSTLFKKHVGLSPSEYRNFNA